jgi:hypothetical protein
MNGLSEEDPAGTSSKANQNFVSLLVGFHGHLLQCCHTATLMAAAAAPGWRQCGTPRWPCPRAHAGSCLASIFEELIMLLFTNICWFYCCNLLVSCVLYFTVVSCNKRLPHLHIPILSFAVVRVLVPTKRLILRSFSCLT